MKIIIFTFLLIISLPTFAKTVLFLGDSLTEGYRLNKSEAFPDLIEKELKKKNPNVKVINGGVSGATSASGSKRLDWFLKAKPDIMFLALGANDGLRGFKVADTERNLSTIIEKAQAQNIKVILAGMKMPTNYGEPYRTNFENMFGKLAKKYDIKLLPFLLEGVAGDSSLNLADGIHPNAEGHKIMAKAVIKVIETEI